MSNSDTAALVACSSSKEDGRKPSWKLYCSTAFEKSWSAAMVVGDPYVMSAKHGLLSVDERVDPYDETLREATDEEKIEWAESLDVPEHYDRLVLFGGRDYVEPIDEVYGSEYEIVRPFDDCGGIGEQMAVAGDICQAALDGEMPL